MKPEGKMIQSPACFAWLPAATQEWLDEATAHNKDIEVIFEHRTEGEFEFRIRTVPQGRRMMRLPPIRVGNAMVEIDISK